VSDRTSDLARPVVGSETPSIIEASWDIPSNVVAFTTTRSGGVSKSPYTSLNLAGHVDDDIIAVEKNRCVLENSRAENLKFQWLRQEHGTRVVDVGSCAGLPQADGLIASESGVACCVLTADCLPIFLASSEGDEVAILHAGWRGLLAGIIESGVAKMRTRAGQLSAWLGPAIGPCHFEVGPEVAAAFLNKTGSVVFEDCFVAVDLDRKYMANLYAIARRQLDACGIIDISGGDFCTHCESEQFFSYRRDGITGRMANIIYCR